MPIEEGQPENAPTREPSVSGCPTATPGRTDEGKGRMAMSNDPSSLPANEPPAPRANILLVDDHPGNLLALRVILEDLGHTLIDARSGHEALRLVLDQDFAVILLDVQMDDLDGFETAKLIRSRQRSRHTPSSS